MMRWTREGVGEAIVDVVLSLDAHTKQQYQSEVATASYSRLQPTMTTLDDIVDRLDEIDWEIAALEGHPGRYLRGMTTGFRTFARLLQGDAIPYPQLIRNIQQLPVGLIPEEKAFRHREAVEKALTELGYKGTTTEKIENWLADTLIPSERVTSVAQQFLDASKKGTLKRVISLPEEDGVDAIQAVRGVFWSGYSKYQGGFRGKLSFNIDREWHEPILAQIMTHEAYPGHQAFYCRWDYLFQQGLLPLEAAYYLINSPTNALFEGGPETALHFLGWDDDNEDVPDVTAEDTFSYRLARDFLDMQRVASTNACYLVNTGQADKAEALAYMERVGLQKSVQAENAYRFFTDPIQRAYFPSYYYGRWMVGKAYDAVSPAQRADYFKILYDTPHTTDTFIAAIAELTGADFDPFAEDIKAIGDVR